ncbi:hypothetical protein PDL02_27325 [Bacillus cereus group sp. LD113LC]|nr:hypothetical protein [Bacillus cereus group sp. LD113LC]MDA1753205.1 hypothetical protein [Bacillus cereus group sp. LD113LC]
MKFGYMRVSTLDQNLDRQKKQLEGVPPHAHQLKNENKMNFRSNKLKNT